MFLRKAWAFFKRDLIERASYKSSFLFYLLGILSSTVTFYFVGKIFGAGAAPYLTRYGGDYFPFVLVGIAFSSYQSAALNSFSTAIQREQGLGTLEAILLTPTSLNTVVLTGSFLNFLSTSLRVVSFLLVGALLFKVPVVQMNFGSALVVLFLTVGALAGFGVFSAGFVLVFKRGNPINYFFGAASNFLAGVYFPVEVLPTWVQKFSSLIPLSYSLEAFRKAILNGEGVGTMGRELTTLLLFALLVLPLSVLFFRWAVKRARREGSLVFY